MRNSIRSRLQAIFIAVILLTSLATIGIIIAHFVIVGQYRAVSQNLIDHFNIMSHTESLMNSCISVTRSADDSERLTIYEQDKAQLEALLAKTEQYSFSDEERGVYTGLKNIVLKIIEKTEQTVSAVKQDDVSQISSNVDEIKRLFTFVQENTSKLIITELKSTEKLQSAIDRAHVIGLTLGVLLMLAFTSLSFVVSMQFSKALTNPLITLSNLAKQVASGNLQLSVEDNLLKMSDETGVLSVAFNSMITNLRTLFGQQEKLNVELKESKENIEKKVIERTQQLSDEQARLQASINSLSIGYTMIDTQNKVVLINNAAQDIFTLKTTTAYPSEKAIDTTWIRDRIDMEYIQDALSEKVNLLDEIEKVKQQKIHVRIKDVTYKMLFLDIFIAPVIRKDSQEIIGTVLLFQDITEQKVLERSRDEFFSIASHELRTPLTAIRGNASIITDYFANDMNNPEVKDMLSDINESSVRLIDIVNDFLDLSRLEQGKVKFENQTFEPVKLCEDVLKEYDVTGSRKKLFMKVDTAGQTLPLVYADRDKLREVIVNLVGNALKFTEQGGISITFKLLDNQVKILVTDTGRGIPESNQVLLFRKFQQTESNILTRDTTSGTGLGLYISRIMMRGMGGEVVLENSTEGVGSCFSITVPIATNTQVEDFKRSNNNA